MPRQETTAPVPRFAVCTCGWSATARDLKTINRLCDRHLADACEGVDHAFFIGEAA